MYVWRSTVFRKEIEAAAPAIGRVKEENYESMPSISIDYALMEHTRNLVAVRGDFGWSDVGSFEALARLGVSIPDQVRDEIG